MAAAAKRRSEYRNYRRLPREAYDGTAVRRLEQGTEVLQPRPQVRPQKGALVRPRVQVREAGMVSIFAVAGFLAVGLFAVLLLFSHIQLNAISENMVELRGQLSQLQDEEAKLRTQYELAYDLSSVETFATTEGGMIKPQNGQIFYVDLSEPDKVQFFDEEAPGEGAAGALARIRSLCGEIVEYFQ